MSLSSFLLKSSGNVDSELDALFKTQAPKHIGVPITAPASTSKAVISSHSGESDKSSKKRKSHGEQKHEAKASKRQKSESAQEKPDSLVKKSKKSRSLPLVEDEDGEDEDNSDLETAYLKFQEEHGIPDEEGDDVDEGGEEDLIDEGDEDVDNDDENDANNLVHESLKTKKPKTKSTKKKEKYVPVDETSSQRDQRTIFIGNLALEVAQKRPLQKQLQRHILSFIPTAKIESIRFRSVPFNAPSNSSSTTPSSDPSSSTSNTSTTPTSSHKNPSAQEHSRLRASSWRSSTSSSSTDPQDQQKTYLNPNQKKKLLFLTHQFHTNSTTCHAYIVFAHPPSSSSIAERPKNLPPLPEVMDPYEAAKEAVKKADGKMWEGRVLRVDFVGSSSSSGGVKGSDKKMVEGKSDKENEEQGDGGGAGVGVDGGEKAFKDADPKSTLFVGNLDLGAQEDDLRAFFEGVMKTERGEVPASSPAKGKEEKARGKKTWVARVRIIRDKDTLLGKGFAYVQFADRECVDEILTLDSSQLKFAKRKLRVQRCKTIPGTKLSSSLKSSLSTPSTTTSTTDKSKSASKSKSSSATSSSQAPKPSRALPSAPIVVPKGDPTLGTKLATMSKEERKAVKANDADRVARRLAKKKARMAMGTSKDRAAAGAGVKERTRTRKGADDSRKSGKGGGKGKNEGRKKGRVRSERAAEKRNAKK